MDIITWENINWGNKQFNFETDNELFGKLILLKKLEPNANFITANDKIQFRPIGFLSSKITLRKNNRYIGEITTRVFKSTFIKLKNNRSFKLSSNWQLYAAIPKLWQEPNSTRSLKLTTDKCIFETV